MVIFELILNYGGRT